MRFVAGLLCGLCVAGTFAQDAAQKPVPPPPSASTPSASALVAMPDPVVHADRTVTFHFIAPSSSTVTVALEGVKDPIPMVAEGPGRWTLTTEALAPEIYSYHFEVNGHLVLDPRNAMIKAGVLGAGNGFLVPGTPPEAWETTAVPHGELHRIGFTTHVVKGLERDQDELFVYTPPGYDARAKAKYPVLFLLHGWSDLAGGWSSIGQANEILDNLIAEGKAKPMIVVMPLGYGDMSFVRNGFGVWQDPAAVDHNTALFQDSLLTEVMPLVEREFNIAEGRENRAIAGLSMGGLESLTVGLNHTGMFAYVGGFSAADHLLKPESLPGLDPKTAKVKLLWIACGTEDGLIEPNRRVSGFLKGEGLPVTEVETPGMHTWMVWRGNLVAFAPMLFR